MVLKELDILYEEKINTDILFKSHTKIKLNQVTDTCKTKSSKRTIKHPEENLPEFLNLN